VTEEAQSKGLADTFHALAIVLIIIILFFILGCCGFYKWFFNTG
jgi:hypothetical protein